MYKVRRRMITVLVVILLLVSSVVVFGSDDKKDGGITSLDQLNQPGIQIGVATDTTEYEIVEKEFPKAEIVYFKDLMLAFTSVADGKVDAFVCNKLNMQLAMENGLKGVRLMDESIGEGNVGAVAISPLTQIPDLKDRLNKFLREITDDGTLADIRERWLLKHEMVMPDIPEAADPKLHLIVGTTGVSEPFTCYVNGKLAGYDIELAKRFAAWLGASLEFKIYDYEGIVAAAQGGDVDCIFANLYVTPERKEVLEFSDPTYVVDVGVMVQDKGSGNQENEDKPTFRSLKDFNDKRIGVCTGTIQGAAVEKQFPDATISYYNTHADLLAALRNDKIDAFSDADIIVRYSMIENSDLTYLNEYLTESVKSGAIFGKNEKGDQLRGRFNEFLKKLKDDGTMKKLDEIWYGADDSLKKVKDPKSLSAENGTLRLATDSGNPPVSYRQDKQVIGLDIDIATRFCEEYGYGLEIVDMSFPVIVNAVETGKCDFGIGAIGITKERAESVNFSDIMYESNSVMAFLKNDSGRSFGFLESLKESFEKTFIRENRWQLFLEGIVTTLLLTVVSILLGTLLGFVVFMLCRRGNRVANAITRFCIWLIEGMPVVVLLMIFYYIVFSESRISGVAVSVIVFMLVFAAAVVNILRAGVAAVGTGQAEAAYSLGYTDRKAFFKIILPQALPHAMPAYKGQIKALIKATAVVGYVAVQDLTKMGDIVRSRTYEAFFPLIAVAVFYFILAALLIWIVDMIEIRTIPGRRAGRGARKKGEKK